MHLKALAASQSDSGTEEDDVSDGDDDVSDSDAEASTSAPDKFDYAAFVMRKDRDPQRKARLSARLQERQLRQQVRVIEGFRIQVSGIWT